MSKWRVCLKQLAYLVIILMNHQQLREVIAHFLALHCLHIAFDNTEKKSILRNKNFAIYAKKDLLLIIKKVRVHCHFTGKRRGTAHSKCNRN